MFSAKKIFISYSHKNRDIALKLKDALEKRGFRVVIDNQEADVGNDIQELIRRSIRSTDITFAIISRQSLMSSWVVMEAMYTFTSEEFVGKKKFVAGFLDEDYRDDAFYKEAAIQIDEKIASLDEQINLLSHKNLSISDLSSKRDRLLNQRADLGTVLTRLRTLGLDLREDKFDVSLDTFEKTFKPYRIPNQLALGTVLIAIILILLVPGLLRNGSVETPDMLQEKSAISSDELQQEPVANVEQEAGANGDTSVALNDPGKKEKKAAPVTIHSPVSSVEDKRNNGHVKNLPEPSLPDDSTEDAMAPLQQVSHTFSCYLQEESGIESCSDVKVFIDGKESFFIGEKRSTELVPATTFMVRAELEGYKTFERLVDVDKYEATKITMRPLK